MRPLCLKFKRQLFYLFLILQGTKLTLWTALATMIKFVFIQRFCHILSIAISIAIITPKNSPSNALPLPIKEENDPTCSPSEFLNISPHAQYFRVPITAPSILALIHPDIVGLQMKVNR